MGFATTAGDAKLQVELSATAHIGEQMTDSGDHIKFTSANPPFSWLQTTILGDLQPDFKVDGIRTGGRVLEAASGASDKVDVEALTCYVNGSAISVSAAVDQDPVRPSTENYKKIDSVTVTDGGVIAIEEGTEGVSFSETRDAAGGPPLIAVTSIEIGQVRMDTDDSAAISSTEIFMTANVHREVAAFPINTVDNFNGTISFSSALMLNHTAGVPKTVFVDYYTPSFDIDMPLVEGFEPPEVTGSTTTVQTYDGPQTVTSTDKDTGSFSALGGMSKDDIVSQLGGTRRWLKFYPDGNQPEYRWGIADLFVKFSYPPGDAVRGTVTVSAITDFEWDND